MRSATIAIRSGSGRLTSAVKAKSFMRRQRIFERDGAGEHAAVELGQDDMHREVGGAEAARAVAPGGALGGGGDDLQHRHAGAVERRRLVACRPRRRRSW